MLDIKFIRENKDVIKAGAVKKHIEIDLDKLLTLDDRRRALMLSLEGKRSEQNIFSEKIVKEFDQVVRDGMIAEMKEFKDGMSSEEEELKTVMKEWQLVMLEVPNIPDMSVPEGGDDNDNQEVKKWGELPTFDFEAKSHVDIMLALDMVDFERGIKVSGFRGYFLKNDGAMLSFAIWQYALQFFSSRGLSPMIVPSLVRRETFMGTGYLPQGEDDLYKTQDGDYLAGTAEVATMG
jgi:seryl-tRNA synthetase